MRRHRAFVAQHRRRRSPATRLITVMAGLALLVGLAVAPSNGPIAQAQTGQPNQAECGHEWSGRVEFAPGDSFVNCNGDRFTFQTDGNVVIFDRDGNVRWATNRSAPGGRLVFQGNSDGNLVVLNTAGQPVWAINVTAPNGTLVFSGDGNLATRRAGSHRLAWVSHRVDCEPISWSGRIEFQPGDEFANCNGDLFRLQTDGNVVITDKDGVVLWAAGSSHSPAGMLVFAGNSDGNLFVLDTAGRPVWAVDRAAPGGRLDFGSDGSLVAFRGDGRPVWSTPRNDEDCESLTWTGRKVFEPGEYHVSCSGDVLSFQTDGNLVEFESTDASVLWATNQAAPAGTMTFQGETDGNLVIRNAAGQPVWATNQAAPGGSLQFDASGYLLVNNAQQEPEYVRLEKARQLLLRELNEWELRNEEIHDQKLIVNGVEVPAIITDERYQQEKDAIRKLRDIWQRYDPAKPCATVLDIAAAVIGIDVIEDLVKNAGAQGLAGWPAVKRGIMRVLAKAAIPVKMLDTLWRLMRVADPCIQDPVNRDLLRQYADAVGLKAPSWQEQTVPIENGNPGAPAWLFPQAEVRFEHTDIKIDFDETGNCEDVECTQWVEDPEFWKRALQPLRVIGTIPDPGEGGGSPGDWCWWCDPCINNPFLPICDKEREE